MVSISETWRSIDDYCQHAFLNKPVKIATNDRGLRMKYVDQDQTTEGRINNLHLSEQKFGFHAQSSHAKDCQKHLRIILAVIR